MTYSFENLPLLVVHSRASVDCRIKHRECGIWLHNASTACAVSVNGKGYGKPPCIGHGLENQ